MAIRIVKSLIFIFVFIATQVTAQENYKDIKEEKSELTFRGGETYPVKKYKHEFKVVKPKNVIFLIGDGMGVSQVFAGLTANGGNLFLQNCKYTGFSKTHSSDDYVTDSAAAGTALATGKKTYNGAIGVDPDTVPLKTILEEAEEKGLATGLVATASITHATPASFIAHQKKRSMYEEIAADFLKTDIDVFIGGGYKHFTERKDGKDLTVTLKANGYQVLQDMEQIAKVTSGKLAGLITPEHPGRAPERGDMLPVATETALNILDNDQDGFFLMVEGSQIDWGGHQNSTIYVVEEVLDFDKAIGKALDFASKDGETLVVVTADHETGGFAVLNCDPDKGKTKGGFTTGNHSAVMVPVFAYGPGAEQFIGIMDNTELNQRIWNLLLD